MGLRLLCAQCVQTDISAVIALAVFDILGWWIIRTPYQCMLLASCDTQRARCALHAVSKALEHHRPLPHAHACMQSIC